MEEKRIVLSGLIWKFMESFFAQIVSFIISIILARLLLPEDYGLVGIVLIFISFGDLFLSSGLSAALVQKKDADEKDFSSIFLSNLFISVAAYIALFCAAPLMSSFYQMPALKGVLRIFALRLILSSYNSVQHAYVSRHMLFRKLFFATLFGTVISGVVGIIMAYNGLGVWALVAQYMINTVINSIVLTLTLHWRPSFVFSLAKLKALLKYGWKVLGFDLMGSLFDHVRGLVVGKVYSSADLAYYNRGRSFVGLTSDNVRGVVLSVLFPVMSNKSDNIANIKQVTRRAVRTLSYIVYPLTIGLCMVSDDLIEMLLTAKWHSAVYYIWIFGIASAIELPAHFMYQSIKALGRSDLLLKTGIVTEAIFVICLICGSLCNIDFFCIFMLVSSVIGTMINVIVCGRMISYSIRELIVDLMPQAVTTLCMALSIRLVMMFSINLLAIRLTCEIVAGGLTYYLISYNTKNSTLIYLLDSLRELLSKEKRKGGASKNDYY